MNMNDTGLGESNVVVVCLVKFSSRIVLFVCLLLCHNTVFECTKHLPLLLSLTCPSFLFVILSIFLLLLLLSYSRMECSVCSHTWFQSRERLGRVGDGFEMITLPDRDLERIQLNIKEGKHPKHFGDYKMYVGNISFQCTEEDLFNKFSEIGPVGDVSMVLDNDGRIRGFGFITMRNAEDGERALELLDGTDLKGRTLNVRPSTN